MRGSLLIDSVDIWNVYGAFVKKGGYNGLLSFPPLKEVAFNDWQEYDGIEPDLSNIQIDRHEFTIEFYISGDHVDVTAFISLIKSRQYHLFEMRSIAMTKRLRMMSCSNVSYGPRLSSVSVKVCDDTPLSGFEFKGLSPTPVPSISSYKLDGVNLSSYGIRVLKGSLQSVLKSADFKQPLIRSVSTLSGVIVDEEAKVVEGSKEIQLECLLRAESFASAWNNLDSFLYHLTKLNEDNLPTEEGKRDLYVGAIGRVVHCYYKSCNVDAFFPDNGNVWVGFKLTMVEYEGSQPAGDPNELPVAAWIGNSAYNNDGAWGEIPSVTPPEGTVWNKDINDDTDWGGDESTDFLPVSYRAVQKYIKEKIKSLDNHVVLSKAEYDALESMGGIDKTKYYFTYEDEA